MSISLSIRRGISLVTFLLCLGDLFAQQRERSYFDEIPPGNKPKIFAPGKISLENEFEFGMAFSSDMKEYFYSVEIDGKTETRSLKYENGRWSKPVRILFHETYSFNDPCLSPDGQRLYFISDRSMSGTGPKKDYDIWFIERKADGWSEPVNAGNQINSAANEYYISFTSKNKMYFSSNREKPGNYDIYSSALVNGEFQAPVKLGREINTGAYEADVFVASDESFIVFSAIPSGGQNGDLFVSFRNADGSWTQRKSLGDGINTDSNDFCPYVSPDGKYFFYASQRDIYWVSIDVIKKMR